MTHQTAFWQHCAERLEQGINTVLVLTVASEKGSPGNAGFKMAIWREDRAKTSTEGTIGGGIMEQRLIAEAEEILRTHATVRVCRKLHHFKHPQKTPSGLICSGSQTILLITLFAQDAALVRRIAEISAQHRNAVLECTPHEILLQEHSSDSNCSNFTHLPDTLEHDFRFATDEDWCYRERIGAPCTAYIVGGGHVGLALSQQLSWLGFRVIVLDSRDIATTDTLRRNTFAERIITTPYTEIAAHIPESPRSFVLILTSGYPTDVQALVSLAGNSHTKLSPKVFAYCGLMGSRAKIATIFREAEAAGVSRDWLARIHAPLGVDIGSDTPEEIAVSIAAELIRVKNTRTVA